jgi:perosamine synthetase
MIPINEPKIFGNEISFIKKTLSRNWISSYGNNISNFEKEIKKVTKSKYAIACINGTASLQVALKLCGAKNGDEVIVPSFTFISTINAISYNNCNPIFMDSDEYFNLDQNKTLEFIRNNTSFKKGYSFNKKTKKKIISLIIVGVWGSAPSFDKLFNECKKRNIKIIEDAAECLGTYYKKGKFKKKHFGTIGDIGCLSFNGNKIITTGGGGMILTNNKTMMNKARYLISQAKNDSINFVHDEIGYNYRFSNLQAAFGIGQIKNLNKIIKKKKAIHQNYKKYLIKSDIFSLFEFPKYSNNNHWLMILQIRLSNIKLLEKIKKKIFKLFKKNKIEIRSVWLPNHLQKPYKKSQNFKIKNANLLFAKSLCLPSSYSLTQNNQKTITEILKKIEHENSSPVKR